MSLYDTLHALSYHLPYFSLSTLHSFRNLLINLLAPPPVYTPLPTAPSLGLSPRLILYIVWIAFSPLSMRKLRTHEYPSERQETIGGYVMWIILVLHWGAVWTVRGWWKIMFAEAERREREMASVLETSMGEGGGGPEQGGPRGGRRMG